MIADHFFCKFMQVFLKIGNQNQSHFFLQKISRLLGLCIVSQHFKITDAVEEPAHSDLSCPNANETSDHVLIWADLNLDK